MWKALFNGHQQVIGTCQWMIMWYRWSQPIAHWCKMNRDRHFQPNQVPSRKHLEWFTLVHDAIQYVAAIIHIYLYHDLQVDLQGGL